MPWGKSNQKTGHQLFMDKIVASETVWALGGETGFANCLAQPNRNQEVFLFWSEQAAAEQAQREMFPQHPLVSLSLFDFLFRQLPFYENEGVLVGVDWTAEAFGLEMNPGSFQDQLMDRLPQPLLDRYINELNFVTNNKHTRQARQALITRSGRTNAE